MAHKHKGQLSVSKEWAKHLRHGWDRIFWKQERSAEKEEIKHQLEEHDKWENEPNLE